MSNDMNRMVVLPEGSNRILGRDAQRINIMVGKAVANAVRSTLGPKGMDKMLVDELGDIIITNDGATILDEMHIEHPAGKMLVEVAKTQDKETGDGTTSAVVIAGELLKKAEGLLDQDIHPSIIVNGYKMAQTEAVKILDEMSETITKEDTENLINVCTTTLGSKGTVGKAKKEISEIIVEAVRQVSEEKDNEIVINDDFIKIEKKEGGDLRETQLIKGILVDKERVHSGMPSNIENAKIALVNSALEIKETETDAEIRITDPNQLQAFLDNEEQMLKAMVEKIKQAGANVLFCQKGIDDVAQHFLAKEGIFAVRRVKKSDIEALSKATGAKITSNVKDLTSEDLGEAGHVEEKKVAGEDMVFIENCKDPKAVTIFIRGGTSHVIDEAERAVVDGIGAVSSAIELGKIVMGGGAVEIDLSLQLRDYAKKVGGREQLAIEAFADALEIIPRTLGESAGVDAIDTLVSLRTEHAQGNKKLGINVLEGKITNMEEARIIEPTKVKIRALASASDATEMILKIDDIIAASKPKGGAPEMPPGGMGGMPGMM